MSRATKAALIQELIAEYRANSNQDNAFDALAADRLGISRTDLHCLDIVENRGRLTAGELASASGLTTGAVTAVVDRLERAGFARRVPDETDRRKVRVEVTARHYAESEAIWRPLMEDWQRTLARRWSADELRAITHFLRASTELGVRHAERIRAELGAKSRS